MSQVILLIIPRLIQITTEGRDEFQSTDTKFCLSNLNTRKLNKNFVIQIEIVLTRVKFNKQKFA